MSDDTERIPVPTNGRGPKPTPPPKPKAKATTGKTPATPPAAIPAAAPPPPERRGTPGEAVPRDQTVPLTPTQLAAGFGIVAGLLLLFVGARRRRGKGSDE